MPDGTERLATTTTVLTDAVRHQTAHAPTGPDVPATWLMHADGRSVTWPGYRSVDVWDAHPCRCTCHDTPPALGHARRPHAKPEPRGPETWPARREQPPPGPPVPVIADAQLDLLALAGGAQ